MGKFSHLNYVGVYCCFLDLVLESLRKFKLRIDLCLDADLGPHNYLDYYSSLLLRNAESTELENILVLLCEAARLFNQL